MMQTVMLNKDQLIQLAGLAASADDKCLIIQQEPTTDKLTFLSSPILVEKAVNGQMETYVMTWTGLHQKRGEL